MLSLFRDLSVRWKVIAVVMLVTTVVLGISGLVVAVMDISAMRNALVERVGALSRVAAINMAAPLAFQDPEAAEEILAALGSEEDVLGIQVRTADGLLFASYQSPRPHHRARIEQVIEDEQAKPAPRPEERGVGAAPLLTFRSRYLDLDMSVVVNGKTLGYMDLQYDTTELGRRILYQALVALLVFFGGMAIAFLLAARLHRLISQPIRDIAEVMERTAAKQDFSVRLDARQRDEMGTLMRAFDAMLEQIELRDVELRKARDAAEAGSQAKSQFLVSMSHEIRTPMNGILGMAELLQGTTLDGRQRHFTQTIQLSAESLLAIINDILDFSKIEAGRLELEQLDLDLCEVLERTMDLLAESARAKGLKLLSCIPAGFPAPVCGDSGRLQQVLTNLLSNAIKFTERGSVQLSLVCLEERAGQVRVRIEVADTGIGLAPDQLERIFERFSQADSSTSRRYGGTGLGLSISKQLVELMDGRMELESVLGVGSVFRVELGFDLAAQEQPTSAATLDGLRALVVTQDAQARAALGRALQARGGDVVCESDLHEALTLALTRASGGEPFQLIAISQTQLPPLEVPAGRVLSDLFAQSWGGLILGSAGPQAGIEHAWGHLRLLSTPVVSAELGRYLDAMISDRAIEAHDVSPSPLAPSPLRHSPLGLDVLVAEDNEVNQEVIDSMLRALGCRVTLCPDGKAALEALTDAAPDVVLMDCQMPEMDGYETARRIRAREQRAGGHVPIVALTAHAMLGDRERVLAAGMDDYLSKPVKLAELSAVLRHWTLSDAPSSEPAWREHDGRETGLLS